MVKTKWEIAQQPVHEENVALMPMKNVILVGAHSVGKTTLAKYLVAKLNLDESLFLSSEIARNVIKDLGVNGDQIRSNPNVCFLFQKAIIQKLHANYLQISNKKFFIT